MFVTYSRRAKFFFTILSLLSALPLTLFAQTESRLDRIIATVGKSRIILQSELDYNFLQYKAENPELSDTAKCSLLQEMIFQKLLAEQADRDSLFVTDEEVDANMDLRLRRFIEQAGSQERLEQAMGKTVLQMKDESRDMIRETLLAEKIKGSLFQNVKITPVEVRRYFDKIPADSLPLFPASVEVGQIVMDPPVSPEMDAYARQRIEEIRNDIKGGKSFESQAAAYSADPGSRDQGGDLGWVQKGQMVPEFEKAAFRLQVGEISNIVKTEYGYHIIQMVAREGEKVHLRHVLIRQERTNADYRAALAKLDSVRAELVSGKTSFQIAVGKYSNDKMSKQTGGIISDQRTGSSRLQIKDLDPSMVLALDSLQEGGFSQPQIFTNPMTGEKSCRIIYLKGRSQPHKANLIDDYSNIQDVALRQKQMDKQNDWLREKLPTFYLKVDKEYADCTELVPWIAATAKKQP